MPNAAAPPEQRGAGLVLRDPLRPDELDLRDARYRTAEIAALHNLTAIAQAGDEEEVHGDHGRFLNHKHQHEAHAAPMAQRARKWTRSGPWGMFSAITRA
jgi:hypothetical protein